MPNYTVFYYTRKDYLFQCRSDFNDLVTAEKFLATWLFTCGVYIFEFMLLDGEQLVKGEPFEFSPRYYRNSMNIAVELPYKSLDLGI